jgi:hypothetical protein
MDVLVMVEQAQSRSVVLAHIDSVPSPLNLGRAPRDVVTFYGDVNTESIALALAAVVEGRRSAPGAEGALRHIGLWPERGAVGDASWRDDSSGELMTQDVVIPLDILTSTAAELIEEFEQGIKRLVAGLLRTDWPEGGRRAVNFHMSPAVGYGMNPAGAEFLLDNFREAQALGFDSEGD